MDKKNNDNTSNSNKKSLDRLRGELYGELQRLKGIIKGNGSEKIQSNSDIEQRSSKDNRIDDLFNFFQPPKLKKNHSSEESKLRKDVRDALIWRAAETYHNILNNPDHLNNLLNNITPLKEALKIELQDFVFEKNSLNNSELDSLDTVYENLIKSELGDPAKLKEESLNFASTYYYSKQDYLNTFENIPIEIKDSIKKEIDSTLNQGSDVFAIRNRIIENILELAEKNGVEDAINERYKIMRTIFHHKGEFIKYFMKGYEINIKIADLMIREFMRAYESEMILEVGFRSILKRNKTIIMEFAEKEAEKIFLS